jgi:FkbM family methyltransferase
MNFEKLIQIIPKQGGVFFEAGGNDGIFQSYTYPLERDRGWTGVLVEPSPQAYAKCTVNRPKSRVFNCALTDSGVAQITGDFDGNPMSSVHGQRLQRAAQVTVRAASLTQIFDAALKDMPVDLMSIDVENYELNVLRSLDYSIYRPRHILAEVYTPSFYEVVNYLLSQDYCLLCNLTNFNQRDNPHWDGSHNDYLFVDRQAG